MRELLPVLGLATLFTAGHGGVSIEGLKEGTCVKPNVLKKFIIEKFAGVWYEAQSVPNIFQLSRKCTKMTYSWNGEIVKGTTTGLGPEGLPTEQSAEMTWKKSSDNVARFVTSVPEMPELEVPFEILSTDYESYACAFSCVNYEKLMVAFTWTLSRNTSQATEAAQNCKTVFDNNNMDTTNLVDTYQGPECSAPPPKPGLPSWMRNKEASKNTNSDKSTKKQTNNDDDNDNFDKSTQKIQNDISIKDIKEKDKKDKTDIWTPKLSKWLPNKKDKKNYNNVYGGYKKEIETKEVTSTTPASFIPFKSVDPNAWKLNRGFLRRKQSRRQPNVVTSRRTEQNENKPDEWWKQIRSNTDRKIVVTPAPTQAPTPAKPAKPFSSYGGYKQWSKIDNIVPTAKREYQSNWGSTYGVKRSRRVKMEPQYKIDRKKHIFRGYAPTMKPALPKAKRPFRGYLDRALKKTYQKYQPKQYPFNPYQSYRPRAQSRRSWISHNIQEKHANTEETVIDSDYCKDKDKAACGFWVSAGECERNRSWMVKHCMKSCNMCEKSSSSPVFSSTAITSNSWPTSSCMDKHVDCRDWASMGECKKNPMWMNHNCAKACEQCR